MIKVQKYGGHEFKCSLSIDYGIDDDWASAFTVATGLAVECGPSASVACLILM